MTRQLPAAACIGHAIRSVRNNIIYAFRISWPWYAILIPISLGASYLIDNLTGGDPEKVFTAPVLAIYFILLPISLVALSSIAVNWHRYILLDEVPHGSEIFRLDDKTWRYLGNVVLISLVSAGIAIAATLILVLASAGGQASAVIATILFIVAMAFVVVLFFRLSIKLPAIALGRRDFHFSDSLAATKDNSLRLLLLAVLEFILVFAALAAMVLVLLAAGYISLMLGLVIGSILQVLFNWIFTIFSITLLTSLYGFFVENRDY